MGQYRPVHAHHTEYVGVELLLDLLQGQGFIGSDVSNAGVVDQHINATCALHRLLHRVLHRCLIGDVEVDHVQVEPVAFSQRAHFLTGGCIAPRRLTHGGEDSVPFAG